MAFGIGWTPIPNIDINLNLSGLVIKMKITKVEAIPFRIPYGKLLSWATGSADAAEHVLVRIHTDEGIVGLAESIPRPTIYGESQVSVCHAVLNWFAPILEGASPFDINRIHREMSQYFANHTAKAAIDMALYDIQAKAAGLPLCRFLGGEYSESGIPVTWMVHLDDLGSMVRQVQEKFEQGYRSFKLKGGTDAAKDVLLVRTIRRELGEEPLLYIDANQGYSPPEAAYVAKQCLEFGVTILEEPIRKELYAARKDFKQRQLNGCGEIQVLGDDSVYTPFDVMRELQERTIDLISLKTARTGVTDSRKIAAIAEQFGAGLLIGTQGDSAIGTMLSAQIAMGLGVLKYPAELSFFTILPGDLLEHPPVVRDGRLVIPCLPGSGVELNDRAFARYRQDR